MQFCWRFLVLFEIILISRLFSMGPTPLYATDGVWQSDGPFVPDVNTILLDSVTGDQLYIGTLGHGLFTSIDGGQEWQATGQLENRYLAALVQSNSISKTLFAATRNGVYRSDNRGDRWISYSTGLVDRTVFDLILQPAATERLFVATAGGVYRRQRDDHGWQIANTGLANTFITTLQIDPIQPHLLYAGGVGGVYLSTDGGSSWVPRRDGLGQATVRTLLIVADSLAGTSNKGDAASTLYAGTNRGLYRSRDGGLLWHYRGTGMPLTSISALAVDTNDMVTLFAGTGGGLYVSHNRGATWQATVTQPDDPTIRTLLIDESTQRLFAGTSGGLYYTTDGGVTWQNTPNGVGAATVRAVAVAADERLYVGSTKGVHVSRDGGLSWRTINDGLNDHVVQALVVDPHNAELLYAGVLLGNGIYRSSDGGLSWQMKRSGLPAAIDIHTLMIDPLSSRTLYAGTNKGLYKSVDGSASWQVSTTGIGKATVQAISADPLTPTLLFAGTDDALFQSVDSGSTWQRVEALDGQDIRTILVERTEPATIYIGSTSALWRSVDAGISWSVVGANLPSAAIQQLINDSTNGLLVALDGEGIYHSNDRGKTWLPLGQQPADISATTVAVAPGNHERVYMGTAEDGLYVYQPTVTTIVNHDVMLASDSIVQQYNPRPDTLFTEASSEGVFTIAATFMNPAENSTLSDLRFQVVRLDHGNQLLDADGGPGGEGAFYTVAPQSLEPGESLSVNFRIGLAQQQRFAFYVDLYGRPQYDAATVPVAHGEPQKFGHFPFTIDEMAFGAETKQLFLPLLVNGE